MNHLPECTVSHQHVDYLCICEQLRACEQRVREEIDREAFVLDEGDPFRQVYRKGLDAGREAVKGFLIGDTDCDRKYWEVIDDIDALKDKP